MGYMRDRRSNRIDHDSPATIDETPFTVPVHIGDLDPAQLGSVGQVLPLTAALRPIHVVTAAVCTWDTTIAADASNFYTFVLRRYRGSGTVDLTTKTTTATPLTQRIARFLDRETDMDADGAAYLLEGDTLGLLITSTGTPPPLLGLLAFVGLEVDRGD